jgi:leishmanolysin-like peptidase
MQLPLCGLLPLLYLSLLAGTALSGHHCVHDQTAIRKTLGLRSSVQYADAVAIAPAVVTVAASKPDRALDRALDQVSVGSTRSALRIHVEYQFAATSVAADTKMQNDLRATVMPHALTFWEKALKVLPVSGPLRFDRSCASSFPHAGGKHTCAKERSPSKCGIHTIASSWLNSLKTCNKCYADDTCESCSTTPAGAGLDNTDFAIIVTADRTDTCINSESTQAYASACRWDQNDRPILAMINFCPGATQAADDELLKATALHELAHALGFSAETWPHMRLPDGVTPRTARQTDGTVLRGNVDCFDGTTKADQFLAAPSSMWAGALAGRGIDHAFKIVTPKVAAVAKAHFGCDTETGAELENQPTTSGSCWGSHWEQRTLNGTSHRQLALNHINSNASPSAHLTPRPPHTHHHHHTHTTAYRRVDDARGGLSKICPLCFYPRGLCRHGILRGRYEPC